MTVNGVQFLRRTFRPLLSLPLSARWVTAGRTPFVASFLAPDTVAPGNQSIADFVARVTVVPLVDSPYKLIMWFR